MHPILVQIGDFFIGTYGLFVALGLLVGLFVSDRRAQRNGVDRNLILDLALIGVVAGIVGARLTYILVNFRAFLDDPAGHIFTRQGFVFGGGMILAVIICVIYVWRKGERVWKVADIIAPAIPLGHGIGRIGCFFAGCCWGGVCEVPWAVTFPKVIGPGGERMGFVYEEHLHAGLIGPEAQRSLPVHPVQLYESLGLILLSVALFWLWKRRRFEGQIFLAYLLAYPVIRFFLEFFRGDSERGVYGPFSTSQYLSLGVFVIALGFWFANLSNRPLPAVENLPKDPDTEPQPETHTIANGGRKRRKRQGQTR